MWRYHVAVDRLDAPGSGERFRAAAVDDGSLACFHRCEKGTYWDDEAERLRHAIAVANEIGQISSVRQLLDHVDREAGAGQFSPRGYLAAIWEWGDLSLEEFMASPDADPAEVADAVEESVGAALAALHRRGLSIATLRRTTSCASTVDESSRTSIRARGAANPLYGSQ